MTGGPLSSVQKYPVLNKLSALPRSFSSPAKIKAVEEKEPASLMINGKGGNRQVYTVYKITQ
jgi:hypothetical protein